MDKEAAKLTPAEEFERKLLETENARLREELGNVLADSTFLPLPLSKNKANDSTKVHPSFSELTSLTSYAELPQRNKSTSGSVLSEGTLENSTFSTTPQSYFQNHQHISENSPSLNRPLMTSSVTRKLDFSDKKPYVQYNDRLLGEIAFQLDRRILQIIFSHRRRLYGFTVRNINEKIYECSLDENDKTNYTMLKELQNKRDNLMSKLQNEAGYDPSFHPTLSELLVNKFGILKSNKWRSYLGDLESLKKMTAGRVNEAYASDVWILLKCLSILSSGDIKPMFQ